MYDLIAVWAALFKYMHGREKMYRRAGEGGYKFFSLFDPDILIKISIVGKSLDRDSGACYTFSDHF